MRAFLGADDVRELPLYLSPESEHWLDWFHVAMRLRVMGQMAKGLVNEQNMISAQEPLTEAGEELDTVDIGKQLERVKWFLWHGNVVRALDTIEDVEDELDLLPQDGENRKKLLKAVREFRGYIEANQNFIPSYGDRYRHAYAILHRQGVVHGDVHLGNLLVDDQGYFRIVDFGLARCSDDQQDSRSRGGVAAFFEPEYARAVLAGARPPSPTMLGEQYAVAAVVYSLLTGEHYLEFSLEQDEMFGQICTDPPFSLARRGAVWWPEAEPTLQRALEKEPARRYLSVESVAVA